MSPGVGGGLAGVGGAAAGGGGGPSRGGRRAGRRGRGAALGVTEPLVGLLPGERLYQAVDLLLVVGAGPAGPFGIDRRTQVAEDGIGPPLGLCLIELDLALASSFLRLLRELSALLTHLVHETHVCLPGMAARGDARLGPASGFLAQLLPQAYGCIPETRQRVWSGSALRHFRRIRLPDLAFWANEPGRANHPCATAARRTCP